MARDYRQGRADGLREALELVTAMVIAEGEKIDGAPTPGNASQRKTRTARNVRRQAYRNAQSRLQSALKRRSKPPKADNDFTAALERIGL